MPNAKPSPMTADEFLVWNLSQDQKYELVDGVPVPLHGQQSGAASRHDVVVVNLIVALGNRLKGKPCRPTTSDQAVRTAIKQIRRPDVTIECGQPGPDDLEVAEPTVVFEVILPSNRPLEILRKVEEYKRHAAIRHIVLIEPGEIGVTRLSRSGDGTWTDTTIAEIAGALTLDPPGVELPLAEIYEGLSALESGPA